MRLQQYDSVLGQLTKRRNPVPTWQTLSWALIAVLFLYAVWQIAQAVRIGSRAKLDQRIARRNDTRRAAQLNTPAADDPSPPRGKGKSAAARKENRLDFSAYLPPEDEDSSAPEAAAQAPEGGEAPAVSPHAALRSFDEDLQAEIDLLSTYDQLSSQFEPEDSASEAAPSEAPEAAAQTASDTPGELPLQPPRVPNTDPTMPREADELVLFSGDGAPPTTLWSRSVPIPHAAEIPAPADEAAPPATAAADQAAPDAPQPAPEQEAASSFPLELELRQFRRELAQMRGAMAEQRQQSARLTEELGGQRALNDELHREINDLREQLQSLLTGQNISPEYSEPLILAQRGMGVDELAEHCGISVAEAQLLCSLAASRRPAEQPGEAHEPQ